MSELESKEIMTETQKKYNFNLLVIFDAVYKLGSVKLAASRLNCSSPSVSQAISRLKDVLGDPLFFRDGQKLTATPLATELYEETRYSLDVLHNTMEKFQNNKKNRIVVECAAYFSMQFIPLIGDFLSNKDIDYTIVNVNHCQTAESISERLLLRKSDIMFGLYSDTAISIESLKIGCDSTVLICRNDHPKLNDEYTFDCNSKKKIASIHFDLYTLNKYKRLNTDLYSEAEYSLQSNSLFAICAHIQVSDSIAIIPNWFFEKFKSCFNLKKLKTNVSLPELDIYMYFNKSTLNHSVNYELHQYITDKFEKRVRIS